MPELCIFSSEHLYLPTPSCLLTTWPTLHNYYTPLLQTFHFLLSNVFGSLSESETVSIWLLTLFWFRHGSQPRTNLFIFIWYISISLENLHPPILSSSYSPFAHPTPLPPFFPSCERCPISSLQARDSVLCQCGSLARSCPPTTSDLTGRDHLPSAQRRRVFSISQQALSLWVHI